MTPSETESVKTTTTKKLVIKKTHNKTNTLDKMASQVNITKHPKRTNMYPSQTISKISRGGKAPKLILQG